MDSRALGLASDALLSVEQRSRRVRLEHRVVCGFKTQVLTHCGPNAWTWVLEQ